MPMQQYTTSTVQMIQMLMTQQIHASVYATQLATQSRKWLGWVNTYIGQFNCEFAAPVILQNKQRKDGGIVSQFPIQMQRAEDNCQRNTFHW